jgi:eukaryotic-like serine/threonine-protein kinase
MAPELLCARPFNRSVDVFALGVVCWETLARAIPWAGAAPAVIKDAVCSGMRPRLASLPPDTPPTLPPLIAAMWDGDGSKRPEATAVVAALSAALDATLAGGAGGGSGGAGSGGDALDALAKVAAGGGKGGKR